MKDLRRTDIEGIDIHLRNYKLLVRFLKKEKRYYQFMNILFFRKKRTIYDLFEQMNKTDMLYLSNLPAFEHTKIDCLWSSIFTYTRFFCYWPDEGLNPQYMSQLNKRWINKLKEDISKRV